MGTLDLLVGKESVERKLLKNQTPYGIFKLLPSRKRLSAFICLFVK